MENQGVQSHLYVFARLETPKHLQPPPPAPFFLYFSPNYIWIFQTFCLLLFPHTVPLKSNFSVCLYSSSLLCSSLIFYSLFYIFILFLLRFSSPLPRRSSFSPFPPLSHPFLHVFFSFFFFKLCFSSRPPRRSSFSPFPPEPTLSLISLPAHCQREK